MFELNYRMDINELLRFADELIFDSTGKHLDLYQQAILRGTWHRKKYSEIAKKCNSTKGHVQNVGSDLWRTMSNLLGEEVRKSNFRSAMERLLVSNIDNFGNNVNSIYIGDIDINVRKEIYQPLPVAEADRDSARGTPQTQLQDIGDAPDVTCFWGRKSELHSLKKWIVDDKSSLVGILGLSGIGKTTLAVRFLELVRDNFECIFWRSLRFGPPAKDIETELLKFLAAPTDYEEVLDEDKVGDLSIYERRRKLYDYLKKSRCLIIFDDVEALFTKGELSGKYPPEYQEYSSLFQEIVQINMDSTLLLISSEKPRELTGLRDCLQLRGLGEAAREIIREEGLSDSGWRTLASNYGGNPSWLKSISPTIANLFNSSIEDFLQYSPFLLNEKLKEFLRKDVQRLSTMELELLSHISSKAEPVSLSRLRAEMSLSPGDLLTAMESLQGRSLLEEILLDESEEKVFKIQPLIKEYLK